MTRAQELRSRKNGICDEMDAVNRGAEGRELTAAESARYELLKLQTERLIIDILTAEAAETTSQLPKSGAWQVGVNRRAAEIHSLRSGL